jgi:uncharacterized protein
MRVLKIIVKGLKFYSDDLVVDFTTLQRIRNDNDEMLYEISPKIHQNNVLAFIGINASGKTMTLKVLSFVIQMLKNQPINTIECNDILQGIIRNEAIVFEVFFCIADTKIYKLQTTLQLVHSNGLNQNQYVITSEILWEKDDSTIKTKKTIFDFTKAKIKLQRTGNQDFLPDDVSIVIALNKEYGTNLYAADCIDWTDINQLRVLPANIQATLAFLDPSIEYLTIKTSEKHTVEIHLKFHGSDEITLYDPLKLQNYLSSGTIKGINVFTYATKVLKNGGYLIIDELENHFNHEIAATLVRGFMNKNINRRGAVMVFSTHYPELLDEFERADNIYIVRNSQGIHVENLSKLLKRSDLKKSEVYQSSYLHGTAPSYEAYINLKNAMMQDGEKA